jgi:hypothetical protein
MLPGDLLLGAPAAGFIRERGSILPCWDAVGCRPEGRSHAHVDGVGDVATLVRRSGRGSSSSRRVVSSQNKVFGKDALNRPLLGIGFSLYLFGCSPKPGSDIGSDSGAVGDADADTDTDSDSDTDTARDEPAQGQ